MKKISQIILLFSLFITCLSHAMWTPLHQAAYEGNLEQVEQLLDAGANANAADENGFTPLHGAAYVGYEAIARLLLDRGANIYAANKYHQTPLNVAELFNQKEVVTLLRRWPKYQKLLEERKKQMYAFLMANHLRLGADSLANVLPKELLYYIWEFIKPTIEDADNFEEKEEQQ